MTTPVMNQIETVVFLMLENRSLDNMLGWLYADCDPCVVYPKGSPLSFEGIPKGAKNYSGTTPYSPQRGTTNFAQPCRVPAFDPFEPIDNVSKQLYAHGNMPKGDRNMPTGDFWNNKPPMTGFAWDYDADYVKEVGQVMGAYNEDQLPVLYGLAKNFAVSDRWFSSIPSQTDPNRAFSICGTSRGKINNHQFDSHLFEKEKNPFTDTNTIFNELGKAGKSWGMYWQTENPLGTGEHLTSWKPYTSNYFPKLNEAPNGSVQPYKNFLRDLANGCAPNFCFLEPFWGVGKGDPLDQISFFGLQGNDYHPPTWIGPAEFYLNELYQKLISSPQWPNMLFIITFDEHGGTYDHVPPPRTVTPDDLVGEYKSDGKDFYFHFDRLGVRVPTILISPFIEKSTVFRAKKVDSEHEFDHTSFIATLLKWAGVCPKSANLGKRVAVAPTFEGVLSETPRTDKLPTGFPVPDGYESQGGGAGHINLGNNLGNKQMDWHEVRAVTDASSTTEEFAERFRTLRQQTDSTSRNKKSRT